MSDSYVKPEKTYWNKYGLQSLTTSDFIYVVNKILSKEFILIKDPKENLNKYKTEE